MTQVFHPRSNTIFRASLVSVVICVCTGGWMAHALYRSSYLTRVRVPREQVVPFSHRHHVAGLGMDCRYCHHSVETAAFAGMPTTETCMSCHSQVWTEAPMLEPVRQSYADNRPLRWTRVHDLPDFTYFDHSIHLHKGIGCSTCHGPVDQMPLVWQEHSLFMKWCLECHRHPGRFMRPQAEIFSFSWQPPATPIGERPLPYHVDTAQLTDCSICHR